MMDEFVSSRPQRATLVRSTTFGGGGPELSSDEEGSACDDPADSPYSPSESSGSESLLAETSPMRGSDSLSVLSDVVPPSTSSNLNAAHYPGLEPSVASSSNTTRRRWDRRNICPYCDVPQAKFARHLQTRHKKELKVQEILSKEKGSSERRAAFKALKQEGNYSHNVAVRCGRKKGHIIPCNRTTRGKRRSAHDFLPCDLCKGFYNRKTLWRHKRACAATRGVDVSVRNIQASALDQLPSPPGESHRLTKVFNTMRTDEVTLLCRSDPTIRAFGEKLLMRLGQELHQQRHISQKMRELGRLLIVLKKTQDVPLRDFFCPAQFGVITEAVREVCCYGDRSVAKPSLALKLGHSVKKCAEITLATALERGDNPESLEQFIRLHHLEWTDRVSRPALWTLKDGAWNKPCLIPIAEDIKKLQNCLVTEMDAAQKNLKENGSEATYKGLAEVLLARVILFNRRRQGEAGRMTIDDWEHSMSSVENVPPGLADCLSPLERHLGSSLKRVMVRGKRRRGVPILLTREMVEALELLLSKRQELGVTGPYVFASGPSMRPLRGCDSLRKYVQACGAQCPKTLTSGALRKHVATMAQLLNLRENEIDQLAAFMGHDIRVHREYYRLPDATTQVAKLSKMLLLMESGKLQRMQGKNLDELDVALSDEGNDGASTDSVESGDSDVTDRNSDSEELEGLPGPSRNRQASGDGRTPADVPPGPSRKRQTFGDGRAPPDLPPVSTRRGTARKRRMWSALEKAAVKRSCAKYILHLKVPGQAECLKAISEEPHLKERTWRDVKYHVYNLIVASKRKAST
ncbi:uncharacterized protein LOC122390816 [Amphibalanus amphitrite]|uniref:uncharacterized protein LOC122390816 n=1 Tax=Amphibalanus amphitrite TaxID=1232801 RepID=UPI001C9217AF|nr:uncharacterized protein LOC122390816 [Amphibalanus amphitrite]